MSTASNVASTLIGGIQDISALLPLLGTEQCEEHVSSALSRGYLYAAASPMSIFGSLGIARAAVKTLLASIVVPSWEFFGAEKWAETRVDAMLKTTGLDILRVHDLVRIRIKTTNHVWNLQLFLATAALGAAGILPYLKLNVQDDSNLLPLSTRWIFPLIRIIGTFLCATCIQIIIQRRLLTIVRKRLIFHALMNGKNQKFLETKLEAHWNFETSSERSLAQLNQLIWETEYPSSWWVQVSRIWNSFLSHSRAFACRCWSRLGARYTSFQAFLRQHPPSVPSFLHRHRAATHPDEELAQNNSEMSFNEQSYIADHTAIASKETIQEQSVLDRHLDVERVEAVRAVEEIKADLDRANSLLYFGVLSIWDFIAYFLLLLGCAGSVIGYILSFSVVQRANPDANVLGPVVWVILEGLLSVVRLALWGWNPNGDDLKPFELLIDLDPIPPFPTTAITRFPSTASSQRAIDKNFNLIPVVPAARFLSSFRFYSGQLPGFRREGLSTFYALTRDSSMFSDMHVLIIALVDHHLDQSVLYLGEAALLSAERLVKSNRNADATAVFTLKTLEPINPKSFPALSGPGEFDLLIAHHQRILDLLYRRPPKGMYLDVVTVHWTLEMDERLVEPFDDEMEDRGQPVKTSGLGIGDIKYLAFGDLQRIWQERLNAQVPWLDKCMAEFEVIVQAHKDNWWSRNELDPHMDVTELQKSANALLFFNINFHFVNEFHMWRCHLQSEHESVISSITSAEHSPRIETAMTRVEEDWITLSREHLQASEALAVTRAEWLGHRFTSPKPGSPRKPASLMTFAIILPSPDSPDHGAVRSNIMEMLACIKEDNAGLTGYIYIGSLDHDLSIFSLSSEHDSTQQPLKDLPLLEENGASFAIRGLWDYGTLPTKTHLRSNGRQASMIQVRFRAPTNGDQVLLALDHHTDGEVGTFDKLELIMNDETARETPYTTRGDCVLVGIHLTKGFIAGAVNLLTMIIPAGIVYELHEVDVLGAYQIPYRRGLDGVLEDGVSDDDVLQRAVDNSVQAHYRPWDGPDGQQQSETFVSPPRNLTFK